MKEFGSVISNARQWSCEVSDAIEFVRSLPDDSVDLLFTSPPYEAARTYGIGFNVAGEQWVSWMADLVKAASPKVKGLIAINCEGQTRNFRYSCVPFLLVADLHRAGFNLRKPPIFHRVGIPGSGGPDWLRNDYEPIVCVTRPGKLPWSNNTACGEPPKYQPGGAMSHRSSNGDRKAKRSETRVHQDGVLGEKRIVAPRYSGVEIANPGNVIRCAVGGGALGHDLAHENEAPFPLKLAEFFVQSFCLPGGIVCDTFTGSGTTCHAAYMHGRRFVGCDIRQSQVDLTHQRMLTITPPMFGAA